MVLKREDKNCYFAMLGDNIFSVGLIWASPRKPNEIKIISGVHCVSHSFLLYSSGSVVSSCSMCSWTKFLDTIGCKLQLHN